jgi:hypothetical protein
MDPRKRRPSIVFMTLGMAFLAMGITTDNTVFSYAAIAFVLIAIVLRTRWFRPRK